MISKNVILKTIDDVKYLQDVIKPFDLDADIKIGSYVVDARSFMGVMGIGMSHEVILVLHTDDIETTNNIFNALEQGGLVLW